MRGPSGTAQGRWSEAEEVDKRRARFAVGSTASMAGVAALASLPLRCASWGVLRWVLGLSGLLSLLVGLLWGALALAA